MQSRLFRKFTELKLWTQHPSTTDAYEDTLKLIRLALGSAQVGDSAAGRVMKHLESPAVMTKVLTAIDTPKRMAALSTVLYEALESVGDGDEIVKEWIEEFRRSGVNVIPPPGVLPQNCGEDPYRRN